jgi:hypothetical protein
MKKILIFLLLSTLSILSCQKESGNDYIIFGSSACECAGSHCIVLYKLDDAHLYKMSNTVQGCTRPSNLQWVQQPDSSFQKATILKQNTPPILKETGGTVGCPDCADQGTVIFEIKKPSGDVNWRLDPSEYKNTNSRFSAAIIAIGSVLRSL